MHSELQSHAVLDGLFEAIDAMDSDRFVSFLTEDGVFRFGSTPAVIGRQAIRDAVQAFFTSISGLSHRVSRVWRDQATLVCEGEVCYRRHDDSEVILPFVNVFELQGDLISKYQIYIDIQPLYAE